jgi:hypothetical protein
MKVRIVCYEDVNAWILGKFALKMQENLYNFGIEVDIAKVSDKKADINHHIIYEDFNGISSNNDTLMITHIDSNQKLSHLQNVIKFAKLGICMSKDTMLRLSSLGLPREKLCFVNPAHDGDFTPRKIQIGFMSRWYTDGRKREFLLKDLVNHLDSRFFAFKIMGQGWDFLVELIRKKGIQVEYVSGFDLGIYKRMISEIDYYLYTGLDEGQMGFVDALASGVKTIVTPQGYHLDVENGITFKYNNSSELMHVFDTIYEEKIKLIKSVESWTWKNYSIKYLELWNFLLGNNVRIIDQFKYKDGIYSVSSDNVQSNVKSINAKRLKRQLYVSGLRRFIFVWYYTITSKDFWDRLKYKFLK